MMLCCPCNRIVPLSARHACALLAVARSADISDDEVLCELPALNGALLHESSRARTMPTDRILTCRFDMTLVGRARSSD